MTPVTVVVGEDEFLVDRAVREAVASLSGVEDVHDLDGAALGTGELESLTSPSLFGGGSAVVIRSAQNLLKDPGLEVQRYLAHPAPDVALVLTHAGGAKGKDILAAARKAQAHRLIAQSIAWAYATGPRPYGEDHPLDLKAEGDRAVSVRGVESLESIEREVDGKKEKLTTVVRAARWTFVIGKDGKIAMKNVKVDAPEDSKSILKLVTSGSK